jgi:peptidoglycan/LPS O-acetylase OafA/YrhL
MLVFLLHLFLQRQGLFHRLYVPLGGGVAGVAIFFFISGYVIPMAVRGQGAIDLRAFLVRRFFRIYPLFLVAVLIVAIGGFTGVLPGWRYLAAAPPRAWAANLLLISEYVGVQPILGVSWTLIVEGAWYAIFAIATLLAGKRAADRLDLWVPVILLIAATVSLAVGARAPLGRPLMIYAAVIGFQCFRYHAGEIGAARLARSVAAFVVVATCVNAIEFGVFAHARLSLAQALWPWLFGTALFLFWVLTPAVRNAAVLNRGPLPALGELSYSIYLLHPIAIAFVEAHVAPELQVAAAIGLTLALAWVGFHAIERPAIRLGRLVARRSVPPAPQEHLA